MKPIGIDQALRDPQLLGASLGDLRTWATWLALLKAAFGLPLDQLQRDTFQTIAGGRDPPSQRVRELWCVLGRRSGKSRVAAALAIYHALFERHALAPGEVGHVLVLAASQAQAQTVFRYACGFIQSSAILAGELEAVTADEIRLRGNIVVGVHANSFRTVRGRTLLAVIADEISFWRDETSATPDTETIRAVLPSLASSNGMLIAISTPYRKMGLLHTKYRDHFGRDGDDVLVVTGDSRTFNPLLSAQAIEAQRALDPEGARSEWDARFRADIAAFLADDVIEAAIDHGRPLELPPRFELSYVAFTDASAGRHDAFTLCVGHVEDDGRFVADVIRGRVPPFDPSDVAREYAALARAYRCDHVVGDAFAGEWTAQAFRANNVGYLPSPLAKSELYLEGLPICNRGLVSIPNIARLTRELRLLERRVHRSGRDTVDHGQSGSDDFANALFGAMHLALQPRVIPRVVVTDWGGNRAPGPSRLQREAAHWSPPCVLPPEAFGDPVAQAAAAERWARWAQTQPRGK